MEDKSNGMAYMMVWSVAAMSGYWSWMAVAILHKMSAMIYAWLETIYYRSKDRVTCSICWMRVPISWMEIERSSTVGARFLVSKKSSTAFKPALVAAEVILPVSCDKKPGMLATKPAMSDSASAIACSE